MIRSKWNLLKSNKGFALPTVTVFIFVIGIAGTAFFSVAAQETRQARYRQNSAAAFMLADGAIERTKAKLLEDRAWRDGWTNIADGDGFYSLSINDTVFDGHTDAIQIVAMGQVENAQRGVELFANVPPAAFWYGLFVYGDASTIGHLCLDGTVYVGGNANFGPSDVHLRCGGEVNTGFDISPPRIYTEPGFYPDATYYDVRAVEDAGGCYAKVFDRYGTDITSALGDSLQGLVSYNNGTKVFSYVFDTDAILQQYFNDATGVFQRNAGDAAVVVNLGGIPWSDPPGSDGVCDLEIDGSPSSTIHPTILNSRFIGSSEDQRTDRNYWMGGITTLKQITIEPYHGLALLTHILMQQALGGTLTFVGTSQYPALVYVTEEVDKIGANFFCEGEIICLGDWVSQGGPEIVFNPGFIEFLPDYFIGGWHEGVSGATQVLRWREFSSSL